MKRILLSATFLIAFCVNALADENVDALCASMGLSASIIMEARQRDVPMSTLLTAISSESPRRNVIMMAYQTPAYRTPEMQRQAIAAFRNRIELICYQSRREG